MSDDKNEETEAWRKKLKDRVEVTNELEDMICWRVNQLADMALNGNIEGMKDFAEEAKSELDKLVEELAKWFEEAD